MPEPISDRLEILSDPEGAALQGAAVLAHLPPLRAALARLDGQARLDLSDLSKLDTAGAWALLEARERLEASGGALQLEGMREEHARLIELVAASDPEDAQPPPASRGLRTRIEGIGRGVLDGIALLSGLTTYLGLFLAGLVSAILHPARFRLTALVAHCADVGVKAVPIVALMAFLIGVVLAFQGSTQLKQFGAEVFVVDLIAVSVIRELGILLTSIIVAGRTASSFTAAIGSMKMREEVDAMRTLGIDPVQALIVPRVLALILMLPILGLIANVMGLVGGALMSWIDLGISPAMFMTRLIDGTALSHVTVGMTKAPVFAVIIGVVGCYCGMQVRGNAESLGMMTSRAVVIAIFAVIVADALFSIFFAEMGM